MKIKSIRFLIPAYVLAVIMLILSAQLVSNTVSVFSENSGISNRNTIVIDPGHGGIDGGTTSVSGALESQINLDIALILRDMFHLLGTKTVMIRTEDVSVHTYGHTISMQKISDLKERVRIVNNASNCILISIHQNYFSEQRYYGPQVFYGENGEGMQLAHQLQESLINNLAPGCNRKAQKATGIYLLQNIDTTGVLIECGFLSNPEDDKKLQSKRYQQQLSCVISSVVSAYMNT